MQDYYKTLGVSRTATSDEIRKAYKKIARENHPDVKPDDKAASERFKQAAEAYDVLGDADKRKQYDQFGAAYKNVRQGSGAGPQWSGGGGEPVDLKDLFGGEVDLGDLFGGMFGGGGRRGTSTGGQTRPASRKGADLSASIHVPFHISAEGGTHEVTVSRDGHVERLDIKIPAGVKEGSVIRLAGQGEPGLGSGPAGDLLVSVHVAPHPYFRRDGNDVLIDVPLTFNEAALGAKVDVPTLTEGQMSLTIPPSTSSGAKLRLRGKGFPDQKTRQRGDQFVVVKIVAPDKMTDRVRDLLEQLAAEVPQSPRAKLW